MRAYLGFMVLSALVAAAVFSLSCLLGAGESMSSRMTGCGISLVASWGGVVPVLFADRARPALSLTLGLGSMGVRLAVVGVLGVSAALSGWFEHKPLLIWLALSYMALLCVDTGFILRTVRKAGAGATEK